MTFRAAVLVALLLAACNESEPVCQNEVIREALSPDGALKAVLFHRACGGPTGGASQVSIVAASETPATKGNALIADTAGVAPAERWVGPDITLEWTAPGALTLSLNSRARIIDFEEQVQGVTINYRVTD